MTRVLLLRHGQSEWNALGRWQGQADPALTDLGRAQAHHAAQALGAVDAIVASDLQRAATTAEIIAEVLGVGPVLVDPDLRERDAGEWSGLTREEIERDWPGYLGPPPPGRPSSFGSAPSHDGASVGDEAAAAEAQRAAWSQRRPPGWEPDGSLVARAEAALVRVHEAVAGGDVLAVTHGGLIYAVERRLGEPFVRIPNLGGRWVEVGGEGPERLGERVLLVSDEELTIPDQL